MKEYFIISYVLLCGMILLESLVLREAVRRLAWLSRFFDNFRPDSGHRRLRLPGGSHAPHFVARSLDGNRFLTASDLQGHETILMFVSPTDALSSALSSSYKQLAPAVHAMWHIVEGQLYVICIGEKEACYEFTQRAAIPEQLVLLDETGEIARAFLIDGTPRALRFDEEGRLLSYGQPSVTEEENDFADAVSTQEEKILIQDA